MSRFPVPALDAAYVAAKPFAYDFNHYTDTKRGMPLVPGL